MYCEYAGCICMVCLQIEGACEDCELKEPGRYVQETVYITDESMEVSND